MGSLTAKYGSSAITEAQAAQELGVSAKDIQSMIELGELNPVSLCGGKIVRIPLDQIDRLLGNDSGAMIPEQQIEAQKRRNELQNLATVNNESYTATNVDVLALICGDVTDEEAEEMAKLGYGQGSCYYSEVRGRYECQFPIADDDKVKRKLVWGRTEAEAIEKMGVAKQLAAGMLINKQPIIIQAAAPIVPAAEHVKEKHLFSYIINAWLEKKRLKNCGNSLEKHTYSKKHINAYFGEVYIQDLTEDDISEYYAVKLEGDVENGVKPLALRTVKDHRELINGTFAYAMKKKIIDENPVEELTLPDDKSTELHYFKQDELNAVLEKIKGHPIESPVVLTVKYGLRRQEVLGLRWSAIDFEQRTLTINHTVTRVGNKIVKEDRTKTHSSWRTFPIEDDMFEYLLELKSKQEAQKKKLGDAYTDSEYVCRWDDGTTPYPNIVTQYWREFLRDNGFKHIRFHDLRHSSASLLLKLGFDIMQIKDWLGHADIKSTMIYAHLDASSKTQAAQKVSKALILPKGNE